MIKVENTLRIYEVNDKETRAVGGPEIVVRSHWNRPHLVVLVVEGKAFTVVASELEAAIDNATHSKP